MSFIQKSKYTHSTETQTFVSLQDWATSHLSADEQASFASALSRQSNALKVYEYKGTLTIDFTNGLTLTWADEATANSFVPDSEYTAFFNRYLSDTGTSFEYTTETV